MHAESVVMRASSEAPNGAQSPVVRRRRNDFPDPTHLRLGTGTTNPGSFNAALTADADTANLLPALGANGLFAGSNAAGMAVRSDVVAEPSKLATNRAASPARRPTRPG